MIPIPIKRQGWTSTSMIVGDLQTRSDRYLQRVEKRGGAYMHEYIAKPLSLLN